jgi:hypothetical protein
VAPRMPELPEKGSLELLLRLRKIYKVFANYIQTIMQQHTSIDKKRVRVHSHISWTLGLSSSLIGFEVGVLCYLFDEIFTAESFAGVF